MANTVDFGASDDPMKKKDMAKVTRGVVQIPMVGGTIAFGYNKPGCNLKLTQYSGRARSNRQDHQLEGSWLCPWHDYLGASLRRLWHHKGLHQFHAGFFS